MTSISYPYPVLGNGDDFQQELKLDLQFEKLNTNINNETLYDITFSLTEDAIKKQIKNGSANYALKITCDRTNINEVRFFNLRDKCKIIASNYDDYFIVEPLVIAREKIIDFTSEYLNSEFEKYHTYLPGDRLAQGTKKKIEFEKKELLFESQLQFQLSKDIKPWEYQFEFDNQIMIKAGVEYYEFRHNHCEIDANNLSFLMMSLYKDLLLCAQEQFIANPESLETRWGQALQDRFKENDLEIPTTEDDYSFENLNNNALHIIKDLGILKVNELLANKENK